MRADGNLQRIVKGLKGGKISFYHLLTFQRAALCIPASCFLLLLHKQMEEQQANREESFGGVSGRRCHNLGESRRLVATSHGLH